MGFMQPFFKVHTLVFAVFIMSLSTAAMAEQRILVWGDSLSAAYRIPVEKGWVNLMRKELGKDVVIINGSISGETTQGGLTRLASALKKNKPTMVLLELGANDGLRGMPPSVTESNLKKMISQIIDAKAKVIIFGMKIPPNYGIAYSNKFERIFTDLSDQYEIPFIPFFLEKIVTDLSYLQKDQLHPTASAQPLLLEAILPTVRKHL